MDITTLSIFYAYLCITYTKFVKKKKKVILRLSE